MSDAVTDEKRILRRYCCVLRTDEMGPSAEMKQIDGGAYVLFAEVADEMKRLRDAIRDAIERNYEMPNGIWSMPDNVRQMQRELRAALGASRG